MSSVPEAIASWRPQAEHAARRRWQAGHQGCPVAREIPHGTVCPQTEQVRTESGRAAGAKRPVRGPALDRADPPAAGAGLQVLRGGDEAVRADRPALPVAGDGLADGSAACARLGAGVRDAGPADPDAVQRLVDAHYAAAAPAGRADDAGDAGVVEDLDEPRDRAQRRQVPVPGQQRRVLFQCPCQFLLV